MAATKTARRSRVDDAQTEKTPSRRLNVQVDAACYKRLMVHCAMEDMAPGEVISALIDLHLKQWAMPATLGNRTASARKEDRSNLADHVTESAELCAA